MSHEVAYLVVSFVVITAFIVYQAIAFPHWSWEAYVGLALSWGGVTTALIRSVL